MQEDSLPAEPPRKPKNTGVGSLSLLQQIILTQELIGGLLHCRRILYQLSYQPSPAKASESASQHHSVMSDSLRPNGLYSHGILQARILEWVTFPFPRGSSQPRDRTQVSHIAGGIFTTREPKNTRVGSLSLLQQIFLTQESNQGFLHCRRILLPADIPGKSHSLGSQRPGVPGKLL